MFVESHNGFQQPIRLEATRVLIRDNMGNPILLVLHDGDRTVHVLQPADPGFAPMLRQLGEMAPQVQRIDGPHSAPGPHGGRRRGIEIA